MSIVRCRRCQGETNMQKRSLGKDYCPMCFDVADRENARKMDMLVESNKRYSDRVKELTQEALSWTSPKGVTEILSTRQEVVDKQIDLECRLWESELALEKAYSKIKQIELENANLRNNVFVLGEPMTENESIEPFSVYIWQDPYTGHLYPRRSHFRTYLDGHGKYFRDPRPMPILSDEITNIAEQQLPENVNGQLENLKNEVVTLTRLIDECYGAVGGKEDPNDPPICVEDVPEIVRQRFAALLSPTKRERKKITHQHALDVTREAEERRKDEIAATTPVEPTPEEAGEAWEIRTWTQREWEEAGLNRYRKMQGQPISPNPKPTPTPAKPEWLAKGVRVKFEKFNMSSDELESCFGWYVAAYPNFVWVTDGFLEGSIQFLSIEGIYSVIPHPDNDPELAAAINREG